MDCTFSPLTDFTKLEAAVSDFYGPAAAPAQSVRFRRLLDGLTESFGPQTAAAVFSAPGRSLSYASRVLPRSSSLVYTSSICHSLVSSKSLPAGSQATWLFSPSRTVRGSSRWAVRR